MGSTGSAAAQLTGYRYNLTTVSHISNATKAMQRHLGARKALPEQSRTHTQQQSTTRTYELPVRSQRMRNDRQWAFSAGLSAVSKILAILEEQILWRIANSER